MGGSADKYECLNEARSWSEGMKKNGCPSINYGKSRTIMSEGIQYEPESNEKGGIIVFSTDVNAVELSPNRIANWVKQKFATFKNRRNSTKMVDRIANKNNLIGWTIGHYLDGRYRAKKRAELRRELIVPYDCRCEYRWNGENSRGHLQGISAGECSTEGLLNGANPFCR